MQGIINYVGEMADLAYLRTRNINQANAADQPPSASDLSRFLTLASAGIYFMATGNSTLLAIQAYFLARDIYTLEEFRPLRNEVHQALDDYGVRSYEIYQTWISPNIPYFARQVAGEAARLYQAELLAINDYYRPYNIIRGMPTYSQASEWGNDFTLSHEDYQSMTSAHTQQIAQNVAQSYQQNGLIEWLDGQAVTEESIETINSLIEKHLLALTRDGVKIGDKTLSLPEKSCFLSLQEFDLSEKTEWCAFSQGGGKFYLVRADMAVGLVVNGNKHPTLRKPLEATDFIRGEALINFLKTNDATVDL